MSKKLNILFATVYGNAENVANNINKIEQIAITIEINMVQYPLIYA